MPPYYFACERCTYINSGNMKLKGSSLVVRLLLLVSASTFVAQQQLMVSSWMLMDSLPLPIKSRRQRSLRHMISTSSETSATQTTCLQQLPQTDQDRNLERWFRDQGILLGNDYRRVQISTSADRSVGGRGLFLTSNLQSDISWSPSSSVIAHQGDILAYIPGHLVLLPSNMQATFPCLFHDNNTQKGHAEFSWQSILTTYVWKALYENPRITSQSSPASSPDWRSWIETWSTDRQTSSSNSNIQNVDDDLIDGPQLPKALHEYPPARIETMARQCHATTAQVRELIDAKYQTFQADWENVQEFIIATRQQPKNYDERKQSSSSRQRRRHDFAELYSLVLSRTSNLGPEWGNQMGIIPLHDMCNHPPHGQEANVELFCLGDIRSMIGNDALKQLLRPLLPTRRKGDAPPTTTPIFMDRDFVLAARRPIRDKEELWLSYKSNEGDMTPQEQLWLLLQYGFPFRPS